MLQFRSLSFSLYGSEEWYRQIREQAVKHMRHALPLLHAGPKLQDAYRL